MTESEEMFQDSVVSVMLSEQFESMRARASNRISGGQPNQFPWGAN